MNSATEDYLKTIYAHTEWQPELITPSQLAAKLGIAPSSVTEMVKKLAAQGLLAHIPYGPLQLTASGRSRALAVLRRHRLLETWLVQEMGYSWDEVHEEAEVLEHTISDRLLLAIDHKLGSPSRDPHGDLIPAADGTIHAEPFVRLDGAAPGHSGRILRISDRDSQTLRVLDNAGIRPGIVVRVAPNDSAETHDSAGTLTLLIGVSALSLPADYAAEIWLTA